MNMKQMLSLALAGVMALSLMACSAQNGGDSSENTSSPSSSQSSEETQNNETPESVTITSLNANKEAAELEVPYDPQRIAILDMASLDILDTLGVGDRVVGTASTSLEYLQDYINDDIANLGTIKEADLEAVMACEPDVIFIGGRLASSYDALSEIAPVVYLATDTELGVVESVRQNATTIASMFGLEDKVGRGRYATINCVFRQGLKHLQAVAAIDFVRFYPHADTSPGLVVMTRYSSVSCGKRSIKGKITLP